MKINLKFDRSAVAPEGRFRNLQRLHGGYNNNNNNNRYRTQGTQIKAKV
jgi:hypothetical protein